MTLTTEQVKEFTEICKPLIKFLCDNCHPHVSVILHSTGAELSEGIANTGEITEFIKD